MAGEKVLIAELDIDTGNVIKQQQELGKEISGLRKQLSEAKKNGEQYTESNIKAEAKLKTLNQQYRNNKTILQGLQATQSGQIKTVAQAEKAIAALNQEWKKSAAINGENDTRTKELGKKLESLRGKYKDVNKEVGNTAPNVGNYTESIKEAIAGTGGLAATFPGAAKGAGLLNKALNVLKANPIILLLTALIAIIRGVIKIFSKNEEAVDKYNKVMAKLSATVNVITSRIGKFFKAFKRLKDLDFKAFGKEVKESFSGVKEEINEAIEAAGQIQDLIVAIRKENIAVTEAQAERRKQIAELILLTRDEEKSFKERAKALQQANELEIANLNEQLSLQQKRVDLAEQELAATPEFQRTDEQRLKAAEERAKLIDLETGSITRQRELLNRVNELENRRLASVKAVEAEKAKAAEAESKRLIEELDLQLEAFDKELELEAEKIAKQNELFKQKLLIDAENEKIVREQSFTNEFEAKAYQLETLRQLELQEAEKTGANVTLINKKYKNLELKLEQETQNAKVALYSQALGNLVSIFGEASKIGKGAAIIQTTIDTYKAAQSSYSALASIPVVGPILGGIAAGAAIASGIARVNKIKAIGTNPKGSAPSPSRTSSSSSVGANITPPSFLQQETNLGASLGTSGSSTSSTQAQSAQDGIDLSLEKNKKILVIEEFEEVEGRRVDIVNQSEL